MSYVVSTALPAAEPMTLAQAKQYLRVDAGYADDDGLITGLITAAREYAERITGRCLAQRTLRQVLDSMPYYTDTIQSQLAYPPSYYSLPRYSTTLWNYSQMIKLFYGPVISVQAIRFVDPDGNPQTLAQDVNFILDRITNPARIFPIPGTYWPPNYYTPNSCEIDYTAGYLPIPAIPGQAGAVDTHNVSVNPPGQQPDSILVTAFPQSLMRILYMLINFWYDHRDCAMDPAIDRMLQDEAAPDFQPTRG